MEKIQNAFLSGVSRKLRLASLSFVFAFLFMGFQANAQYVPAEDAIPMLEAAASEIKMSDFNFSAPTSTGAAVRHPAQLKKTYFEYLQVRIKKTNDVAKSITQVDRGFADRYPAEAAQWGSQFKNDVETLLEE